ncbi:hypothetical protein AX15_005645 [Amanita polypyramis BW_CC]|nr:hypothetical protein AX15_005645 [Amanita polypyramis BW_CC]
MFPSVPFRPRSLILDREKRVAEYNRRRSGLLPLSPAADGEDTADDELLNPGEVRLYSYFLPSLQAGIYSAAVSQKIVINATGTNETLSTPSQAFHVVAPRFALEKGEVFGFYPPEGQGDFDRILPHIILRDKHIPWARAAIHDEDVTHNAVPWLVLLVFTADELILSPSESEKLLPAGAKQNSTGAVPLKFQDIFNIKNLIASPFFKTKEKIDPETSANFVFMPGHVFNTLFCGYNPDGSPKELKTGDKPDPTRYKYLAHCREINTMGLPEAIQKDGENQFFSIVVSHRTPPVNLKETTGVCVHLISIENIEDVEVTSSGPNEKRVAMCSLHSWTYKVFSADTPTLEDRLRYLGNNLDVFRPAQSVIDGLGEEIQMPPEVLARLKARACAGYTLVRYRISTGDQTIAFTRSPFVPGLVAEMPNLPMQSLAAGMDLQILDQHLGIMDITYSSAWQLGKSLAMADRSFTAALVRLRTKVAIKVINIARLRLVKQNGTYYTLKDTLENLVDLLEEVSTLPQTSLKATARAGGVRDSPSPRWYRPPRPLLDLSFANPTFISQLEGICDEEVAAYSTALNEGKEEDDTDRIRMCDFLLDRISLYSVPPHYFIPDPALLPKESLRFFAIDKNWTNVLIDGALSAANHQQPYMDIKTRQILKKQFEEFLKKPLPNVNYPPQVPTYGMLLRSDIVAQFPSLSIRAPIRDKDNMQVPILRHSLISDDTLLVLFDREPGSEEFQTLTIQMPPHEQRFSVGDSINADKLIIWWKHIFTAGAPDKSYPSLPPPFEYERNSKNDAKVKVYDWPSRTLNMDAYTTTAFKVLTDPKNIPPGTQFDEVAPTAVIAAIELNDPVYEMTIGKEVSLVGLTKLHCPIAVGFGPQAQILSLGVRGYLNLRHTYGLWPAHDVPTELPTDKDYKYPIPNDLEHAIDIVFSIVPKDDPLRRILTRVEVELTLGDSGSIMQSYNGSGAYLASDMHPAEFVKQEGNKLIVGILPRGDNTNDPSLRVLAANNELTFILKGCAVVKDSQGTGWVTVREHFERQKFPASGRLRYQLAPGSPKDRE